MVPKSGDGDLPRLCLWSTLSPWLSTGNLCCQMCRTRLHHRARSHPGGLGAGCNLVAADSFCLTSEAEGSLLTHPLAALRTLPQPTLNQQILGFSGALLTPSSQHFFNKYCLFCHTLKSLALSLY